MNTTIEALQALYVQLGGELTDTYPTIALGVPVSDYTTIPNMIKALTKKAGSGGSSLPAVTAEDEGSVLSVVNGAWDKANAQNGAYDVPCSVDMTAQTPTITTEVSFADVLAAVNAGKIVRLVCNVDIGAEGYVQVEYVPLTRHKNENGDVLMFGVVSNMGDGVYVYIETEFYDGGMDITSFPLTGSGT